jgi:hypothetical protein
MCAKKANFSVPSRNAGFRSAESGQQIQEFKFHSRLAHPRRTELSHTVSLNFKFLPRLWEKNGLVFEQYGTLGAGRRRLAATCRGPMTIISCSLPNQDDDCMTKFERLATEARHVRSPQPASPGSTCS